MQVKDLVAVCDEYDVIKINDPKVGSTTCLMGNDEVKPYLNKTIQRMSQFNASEYATMMVKVPQGYEVTIEDDYDECWLIKILLDRVGAWYRFKPEKHILYVSTGHSGFEFQFDVNNKYLLEIREPGFKYKNEVVDDEQG